MFAIQTTCGECGGRGETFDELCAECGGSCGTTRPESLTVTVPPGVAEGQSLRLKGKGNDLGQGAGDLYCAIHVAPDPRFSREGDDLHACLELEGDGETRVHLPFGTVRVRVPADAAPGDRIEMRGHGITKLGSPAVPRPTGNQDPYRTIEASEHRGNLVVRLVAPGQAAPYSDHATLGVNPDASLVEIQTAYRRLAVQLHPDRNPNDPDKAARFARVSEAYARLSGTHATDPIGPDAKPSMGWIWPVLAIVAGALIYALTK